MLKTINLENKCGSCDHFRQMGDTAQGECLQNPYGETVVHDPKHPYWIVARSRIKCRLYNAKPHTNADRIRAMSDEELAEFLQDAKFYCQRNCEKCLRGTACISMLQWLKQTAEQ